MGNLLKDYIARKDERAREHEALDRAARGMVDDLVHLEFWTEMDERSGRPSEQVTSRHIDRILNLVDTEPYDDWVAHVEATLDAEQQMRRAQANNPPTREERMSARLRDLESNFLHQEFGWQLLTGDPQYRIWSYSVYCNLVAARALIRLLALNDDGMDLLQSINPERLEMPDVERVKVFYRTGGLDEYDPEVFFQQIGESVPNWLNGVQVLLVAYGDAVRVERDRLGAAALDTPLPDDPSEYQATVRQFQTATDDRLNAAITTYAEEALPADEVARMYGIGQKRLRTELRERGLLRARGGGRGKVA